MSEKITIDLEFAEDSQKFLEDLKKIADHLENLKDFFVRNQEYHNPCTGSPDIYPGAVCFRCLTYE